MPDIRLSDRLLNQLDKIAQSKGVSRSQLVNDVLLKYVETQDHFVSDILPDVVRSMVKQEISSLTDTSTDVIKDIYISVIKLRKVTETLETFLLPEYKSIDYDNLKTSELLALIELSEHQKSADK